MCWQRAAQAQWAHAAPRELLLRDGRQSWKQRRRSSAAGAGSRSGGREPRGTSSERARRHVRTAIDGRDMDIAVQGPAVLPAAVRLNLALGRPGWSRRFAGRLENGRDGFSDPALSDGIAGTIDGGAARASGSELRESAGRLGARCWAGRPNT